MKHKLGLITRALAVLSPERAIRRAAAEGLLAQITAARGYEAAKRGRTTDGWVTTGASGNAEAGPALTLLRNRVRDLMRNDGWAKKARREIVTSYVGSGITPRADTGDEATNAALDKAWKEWVGSADADGRTNIYGLQAKVVAATVESGEVLMRRVIRPGSGIPLRLELLEADHLDHTRNEALKDGSRIVQGVEFGPDGRREAYWLWTEHPGECFPSQRSLRSVRIPASEILHVAKSDRPKQVRGMPWLHAVTLKVRDMAEADEAELWRFKVAALLSVFVKDSGGATTPLDPAGRQQDGKAIETLAPGMVHYLQRGREVQVVQPATAGDYAGYMRWMLHGVAAGADLPYDILTGDLSQANFASLRAGRLSFARLVEQDVEQWLVPQACDPVWRWFVDAAVLAGIVQRRPGLYAVDWTWPGIEQVDEYKAAMAALTRIRAGLSTLPKEIARLGYDPRAVLAEIAATNADLDEKEIVLDSDPRRVSRAGVGQMVDPGGDPDGSTGGKPGRD